MKDYEKLGVFYLGRAYDQSSKRSLPELLLYESKHLVTHALVVGMTGSGKTGLCLDIIEEAAMDGIPCLAIDPKGDLGNLLLTFPELRAQDFAPWINEDDAQRSGVAGADFAAQQAELWRQGLAASDQEGERIQRLRAASEFAIYTPGSSAGLPISILKSFATPTPEILEDGELLRERVNSTVTGLLGLLGMEADAVKNRESILLGSIFQSAWLNRRDLDLPGLIQQVQNPPVQRIGVLELETFYPGKERFELALRLNSLLASPTFGAWTQGEPLDVAQLLHTSSGKPRVTIFSIAHLGDAERMFFVTLLLNEVLGWMRAQSGTNSLRVLVYMDEILGYFPPVANPPSKQPLLTLLKQARAFGVGMVLATQNPVDLDYKALANIGSWFIGRLQTDRDRTRILEALEGAALGHGASFDRSASSRILAGLGRRVFLLHDVFEDAPRVFESRWTMSYLRGPLSLAQIKSLTAAAVRTETVPVAPPISPAGSAAAFAACLPDTGRPVLPPEVPQFFAPVRSVVSPASNILYQPRLLGLAQVRYADSKLKIDMLQDVLVSTEINDSAVPVDWAAAEDVDIAVKDLQKSPTEGDYAPCAPAASQVKNYANWSRDFTIWIQNSRKLELLHSSALNQFSGPGESERDFRVRLQHAAREARDETVEKLRQKYAPRLAVLQERLRRAEASKQREAEQATRAKLDTVISIGSTLLGAFLGRKAVSVGTVGKAATAMRSAGRAVGQASDVGRAQETVEAVQQQLQALETELQTEVDAITEAGEAANETLEKVELRAAKINVRLVALVWLPFARAATGALTAAY